METGVFDRRGYTGTQLSAHLYNAIIGITRLIGFDFAGLEMAEGETRIEQFPQHTEIITCLTR